MGDSEDKSRKTGRGISREHLQGKLQDPSGVDIWGANDQQMPAGGEGLEGGAAGKFTRSYHEGEQSGGNEQSSPATARPKRS